MKDIKTKKNVTHRNGKCGIFGKRNWHVHVLCITTCCVKVFVNGKVKNSSPPMTFCKLLPDSVID